MPVKLSILITSQIQFHTAKFYLNQFRKNNIEVDLYTYKFISDDKKISELKKINLFYLEDLGIKYRIVKWVHFAILILNTPLNFSPMYVRWVSQRLRHNYIALKLFKIFSLFPKGNKKKIINKILKKNISLINPKLFQTKVVLNFTTNDQPHLLCNRNLKIITVVESWDHPYKFPIGYVSDKVLVWNNALKKDWEKFQGDKNIEFGYQTKFDYLIKQNKNELSNKITTFMYPLSTSSNSDKNLYEDELKFIEILAKIFKNIGKTLYLKPKPSTPIGELDYFNKFPNINILSYQESIDGANYSLSKAYNKKRTNELNKIDLIITRGTTFVFDAAIYGKPILLLNFRTEEFKWLSKLNKFPHLKNHFFSQQDKIIIIDDKSTIDSQIENIFNLDYLSIARVFTKYINSWLQINVSSNNIISSYDKIIKEL